MAHTDPGMTNQYRFFVFTAVCFLPFAFSAIAQHPKDYFRSPLDIPLFLSGNFGELRNNHFHAGLDIKTQGMEGKPVFAPADGFVSRIKIAAGGYGNALYVTHPNGYVSVYGHLSTYSDTLRNYIRAEQYRKESFEIELFPDSNLFRVKKGDVIAYTGNTGASAGPHLHFELRDVKTEIAYNPLFFGFDVNDNTPPTIASLAVYGFDENQRKGFVSRKIYSVTKTEKGYTVNGGKPIQASGITGFGISATDRADSAHNQNGTYSIELLKDSSRIYFHKIDEMAFHLSRFLNSHIDYELKVQSKKLIQKSFVEPGNQLKIYDTKISAGKTFIEPDNKYKFRYVVKDFSGNASTLDFTVEGIKPAAKPKQDSAFAKIFYYDSVNVFLAPGLEISMPDFTIYRDVEFMYSAFPKTTKTYSAIHKIHKNTEPVQREYSISITPDSVPENLREKLLIATVSGAGAGNPYSEGGEWIGNAVTTKTRTFGNFTVMADTVKPTITPVNITKDGNLSKAKTIKLKISDNLSGIGYYRATIDGSWILMEYDAKNSLLTYNFDNTIPKGKRYFEISVSDKKNNTAKYEAAFYR